MDFELRSGQIAKPGSHIKSDGEAVFEPPNTGQAVMIWEGRWTEARVAERYKPSEGSLKVLGEKGITSTTAGRVKRVPDEEQTIIRDWTISCKFLTGHVEKVHVCKDDTVVRQCVLCLCY